MPYQAILLTRDPGSTDIWAIANSPILWICALGVFAVIFLQTILYMRAARKVAPGIDMPIAEVKESFRAGAVASIGPSLAVVIVAVSLLALFGTPAVLVRIGLIGSAATETASAGIAASTMGAELGGPDYTQQVFAVAFLAMSLSGGMWMLATLILTPVLKRGSATLAKRNPAAMALIPTAALLGAFSMLTIAETGKSGTHIIIVCISAAVMGLCLLISHLLAARWLKEWALGIAILVSLFAAYLIQSGS
ncbi:DUF5058 family protein [Leucobacter luti]|uniref:Uncharacterized protein DUF5058 n=1 Tax=Leucobacter luti TaxID=340320 RepID=A0A4R6S933_9MICO|nr:DUF5058 family protein [Leucobacter luti]MCW2288955.1 hypothetical protein [Leucobacter luti]QYM75160.1 DUF5058 family protein [Leucobacter luti]TCK44895.1 uncharacterized protein DUF5058 [Leucobacter luti]TDP95416.1 uncharacterized protein DUF5058 [Leucobacter luti]